MVLTIDVLKTYFESYDRPTGDDFSNLIDTLSTQFNFVEINVATGSGGNIADSINDTTQFTLGVKELAILHYEDGVYIYNNMEPGTYGNSGGIPVLQQDFIHIAPPINIINDSSSATNTTFSSDYISSTFATLSELSSNYLKLSSSTPQTVASDITFNGEVIGDNLLDPTYFRYDDNEGKLYYKKYGDVSDSEILINTKGRQYVKQVNAVTTLLADINNASITASDLSDPRATLYIYYKNPASAYGKLYMVLTTMPENETQPLVLNQESELQLLEDDEKTYLNDYSTTSEITTMINNASLGFTYSVSDYDSLTGISSPTSNELALVRATVSDDSSNTPNYDSDVATYSDSIDGGDGFYYIYSPVYKYNGTSWEYNYQMASQHTHTSSDITDFDTAFSNKLSTSYLSELNGDTNSLHFTQSNLDALNATAPESTLVTLASNQAISGNKTFTGIVNFSQLSSGQILELDASKNVTSAAKNSGYNLNLGTTSGTVAEGNHSHIEYGLLVNQIDRHGDDNIGKIGFGLPASSDVNLTGVTGLFTDKLYFGTYGTNSTTDDNLIIDKDSILFATNGHGDYSKLEKVGNGNGLQFKSGIKVSAKFSLAVSLYYSGTDRLKTTYSGIDVFNIGSIDSTSTSHSLIAKDGDSLREISNESWNYVPDDGSSHAFKNDWTNDASATFQELRYRKDLSGVVHIQGMITGGTGSVVFTLPEGYYNTKQVYLSVKQNGESDFCQITIDGGNYTGHEGDVRVINYGTSNQSIFVSYALD